jgi:hypothetical protein
VEFVAHKVAMGGSFSEPFIFLLPFIIRSMFQTHLSPPLMCAIGLTSQHDPLSSNPALGWTQGMQIDY